MTVYMVVLARARVCECGAHVFISMYTKWRRGRRKCGLM